MSVSSSRQGKVAQVFLRIAGLFQRAEHQVGKDAFLGPVRDFLDQLAARQDLLRRAKANKWPNQISLPRRSRQKLDFRRFRFVQPKSGDDPAAFDRQLLTLLGRYWRHRRRIGGRLEQLLDYLWTCYLITRDCEVRQLSELLGEDRVAAEVVL